MKKIDVFTPTRMHDGLKIVGKCLERQTFKDFRWVIVDEDYDLKWANENLSKSLDILYLPVKTKDPKRKYGIMNARNTPVPFFNSELIVEIQDYHWFTKDTLSQFWDIYKRNPLALVSGYYAIVNFHNYDKAMELEELRDEDVEVIDKTLRVKYLNEGEFVAYVPEYLGYEMNISSIALSVLQAIYPLDESLDDGYQSDPHLIALSAMALGCSVIVANCIRGYSFEHKLLEPRPEGWQEDGKKNQKTLKAMFGKEYLTEDDIKPGIGKASN